MREAGIIPAASAATSAAAQEPSSTLFLSDSLTSYWDQHSLFRTKVYGTIGCVFIAYLGIFLVLFLQSRHETHRANCLAGGVLLAVGLVHTLPGCLNTLGTLAAILCGTAYLLLFGVEQILIGMVASGRFSSNKRPRVEQGVGLLGPADGDLVREKSEDNLVFAAGAASSSRSDAERAPSVFGVFSYHSGVGSGLGSSLCRCLCPGGSFLWERGTAGLCLIVVWGAGR